MLASHLQKGRCWLLLFWTCNLSWVGCKLAWIESRPMLCDLREFSYPEGPQLSVRAVIERDLNEHDSWGTRNYSKGEQQRPISARKAFLSVNRSNFSHSTEEVSSYTMEGGEGSATAVLKSFPGSDSSVFLEGLMPKREIGVLRFLEEHPNYDGRGVKIAIFGENTTIPG